MDDKSRSISEFVKVPDEYHYMKVPKQLIAEEVRQGLKDKHLSLRKAANRVEGMSFPQIARITAGENYNIDTLLKVLNILDLEIKIVPRKNKR